MTNAKVPACVYQQTVWFNVNEQNKEMFEFIWFICYLEPKLPGNFDRLIGK